MHQAGLRNTVGLMGTAMTDEQVGELARLAPTVLLALDADSAGQEAMLRAARVAAGRKLALRVVPLPPGSDPADLAPGRGPGGRAARSWGRRCRSCASASSASSAKGDLSDAEGKDAVDRRAAARSSRRSRPARCARSSRARRRPASTWRRRSWRVVAAARGGGRRAAAAAPPRPGAGAGGPPTARPARAAAARRRRALERTFLAQCLALAGGGPRRAGGARRRAHVLRRPHAPRRRATCSHG